MGGNVKGKIILSLLNRLDINEILMFDRVDKEITK
jgi:hypothetical protein